MAAGIGLAAQASAQPPAVQFSADAFRAHVAFLADDLLEGREAGSRGYDLAARYVASQFEALGLEPAAGGNWLQGVQFVHFATAGTPRLTVGGRVFRHGEEMVVRPSPDPAPTSLEAPLVFAGYGLDLPARGFDDYDGLDVSGSIVVVLNGTPRGTPSDVAAHLNAEKARMAARRGAVGLIVVRTGRDAEALPWTRYRSLADRPGTTWIDAQGRPHLPHDLRFTATVEESAAAAMFAGSGQSLRRILRQARRRDGRPAGMALAQAARFEREGASVTPFASSNVVALLPGSDPAVADEPVLLMAHLDGLGLRPAAADGTAAEDRIRNGAMDNATGVATLIEVAGQMSRPGNRPRRPVLFAAVTAEEVGLLGAEYLARNPVTRAGIVAVVNLDMPVLTYDFRDVIAFGAEHSTLGPIVARAAARMGVTLSPDPLPHEGLFTRSDHYKFVREGVPAVFLMTGFAGEGRRRFTAFLDEHYHGPSDDLAQPFDWNAGARFAQLNYLIAREIADSGEVPLWYADSFFGAAFGGDRRRAERPAAEAQAAARRPDQSR
ncbi:MAG TPA: M28 family metallopeptidase [Allosphingosinicella sp.]|nr:M28 family metallopeptidase [Allosphingosinicella sp.]